MRPASIHTVEAKEHFVHQEGKAVFKFAVTNMADVSAGIMERNNLSSDDVAGAAPSEQAHHRCNGASDGVGRKQGDVEHPEVRKHHFRYHSSMPMGVGEPLEEGG